MKTVKLIAILFLALSITLALVACDINISGDLNGTINDTTKDPGDDPTTDDPTTDDPTTDDPTDDPIEDPNDNENIGTNEKPCYDGKDHIDYDYDGHCDKCGADVSDYTRPNHPSDEDNSDDPDVSEHEHIDYDRNRHCDKCGAKLDDAEIEDHGHFDVDGDYLCDLCGEKTDNYIGGSVHEHYDKDGDGRCEECGDKTDNYIGSLPDADVHLHFDADGDLYCDFCKKPMSEIGTDDPNDSDNPPFPGIDDGHAHFDENGDALCDKCGDPIKNNVLPEDELLEFDNPRLENTEYVYEGASITLSKILGIPDGCSVYMFPDELIVDAGEYEVTFTVEHPKYKTCTFTEIITVQKADYDMSRAEFLDAAFDFDGYPKEICVGGTYPADLEITYTGNGVTDSGTHYVTAHFKGDEKNYNPIPDMTAKIVIGPHYKVYFDTGVANIEMETQKVGIGAYYYPDRLQSNEAYDFCGWYLSDAPWNGDLPINSDITLTAKWQAREYKIAYFTNGGENSEENPHSYSIEELEIELKPATLSGKLFGGWYLDEAFENRIEKITDLSLSHFAVYAKWIEPYCYSIENEKVTILGFGEPHPDVVIPEEIEGYPVVAIANDAFCYQKVIKSVYIPDSVTYIGTGVFPGCTQLKTIRLPSNLEFFGTGNFYSCHSLEYTAIDNYGAKYLGNENNPYLVLAYFYGNDLVINESTKIILNEFLGGTGQSFDKVVIPNSVEIICDYAFVSVEIKELIIGNNVTYIGDGAFSEISNLKSVVIPDKVNHIGYYAFSYCPDLESITLYDNLITVKRNAFVDCPKLQFNTYDNARYLGNDSNPYVYLHSAVSTEIDTCNIYPEAVIIGSWAFSECRNLTAVTMPDTVRYIGDNAFYYCESLESIVIPDGVTEIFDDTFFGCEALKKVTLYPGEIFIHDDAFSSVYYYFTIDFYGTNEQFKELMGDWYCDWWEVRYIIIDESGNTVIILPPAVFE